MAVVENRFVCDLKRPVQAQALKGNVFSLDNLGSRLSVLIYDNGQPATISGSITANCILPDGSTVNVNGGLTTENGGSKAYVDVPQSCLLITGILKIAIKCTSSSVVTTLAAIVANVYMTKTDNVITPSQQIIDDWNAEISAALATIGTVPTGKTVVGLIDEEATLRADADNNLLSAVQTEATLRAAADSDLKSALSDGFYKIDADWARGTISNGSYSPSNNYRVATKTAIALHKGDVIICTDSYRFDVYGTLEWTTNGVIQADGNYLIQIRQEPEATSQITNIEPFVNAVKINTIYQREIDELDYSKSNYEPTGNLVDKNHLFANSLLQHGTGIAVNGSGYITDFIPVKSGEVLQWRNVDSWYAAFYNTSKEYTSNITLSNNTYTVPADGYIRATITSANLNSAVICRWLNWSNNSNYEKSANDLVARSALKNGGTYSFEYFCGVIGGDGKLQKYVAPSTRIAAYPPLYISEGKVNISVESPYQWACSAYKN
jgi:hypothetical protein